MVRRKYGDKHNHIKIIFARICRQFVAKIHIIHLTGNIGKSGGNEWMSLFVKLIDFLSQPCHQSRWFAPRCTTRSTNVSRKGFTGAYTIIVRALLSH
jgi:hypothetical protein